MISVLVCRRSQVESVRVSTEFLFVVIDFPVSLHVRRLTECRDFRRRRRRRPPTLRQNFSAERFRTTTMIIGRKITPAGVLGRSYSNRAPPSPQHDRSVENL